MKNITIIAETRIKKAAHDWVYERWHIVEPEMIESLVKMMQEEFCHGLIEGNNIAAARSLRQMKKKEMISEDADASNGRR